MRGATTNAMSDWRTAHAFGLEMAKREIQACTDLDKLKSLTLNLLLQNEAQKEMLGQLLLERQ